MKREDAEKIMSLFRSKFSVGEQHQTSFFNDLLLLELSNTSSSEPKIDWIAEARSVATSIAEDRGQVSIVDVLDECPLPSGMDGRIVGGVFKCNSFSRVDSITIKSDDGRWKTVGVYELQNSY